MPACMVNVQAGTRLIMTKVGNTTQGGAKKTRHSWLRASATTILVLFGCLAVGGFVIAHWAERQVLTTDNWAAMVAPLPQKPVVNKAISSYVTTQLFTNVPIEQTIEDALPPKAAFLAGPLTDQLKTLTTNVTSKIISSDNFQTIWVQANKRALDRAIAEARGEQTAADTRNEKFTLKLASITPLLRERLANLAPVIPAIQPNQTANINLAANLQSRPHRIKQAIRAIDFSAATLLTLAVTCFVWAMVVTVHRRRTTIIIIGGLVVVMLLELIIVKLLRQQVLVAVHTAQYRPAVGYVYDTLLALLRQMLQNGLILLVLAAVVWIFVGPAEWTKRLRARLSLPRGFRRTVKMYWQNVRAYAYRYKLAVWIVAILCALAYLAFGASIAAAVVVNCLLLVLLLGGILQLIAQPSRSANTD